MGKQEGKSDDGRVGSSCEVCADGKKKTDGAPRRTLARQGKTLHAGAMSYGGRGALYGVHHGGLTAVYLAGASARRRKGVESRGREQDRRHEVNRDDRSEYNEPREYILGR